MENQEVRLSLEDIPEEAQAILVETLHVINIEKVHEWILFMNQSFERNEISTRLESLTVTRSGTIDLKLVSPNPGSDNEKVVCVSD